MGFVLGGGNWMFTMLAFERWGLDLKRDNITFRVTGDTGVRAQSIATGVIDGSLLGYTTPRFSGNTVEFDMAASIRIGSPKFHRSFQEKVPR